MKAYILTEGGKDIGLGHITRCISLYQAFEEKDITSEFIVNGDDSILDLLKGKNNQIFNWTKQRNKLIGIIGNADVVVIDSYLAEKALYDRISEITGARLAMIDDYNRLEYPRGVVVNPSIYGDRLGYSQKDDTLYLLGKEYIILRKEFWGIPEKKINKKIKNVLITFGGMSHFDVAHKIINYLKDKFDFAFYITEPRKKRLNAKEMLSLMLEVDICISAGGQTTYELARVGTPTIGICFADNQRLNLEGWREKGFIEYIEQCDNPELLNRLTNSIEKLFSFEERNRRSKIGKSFVDGKGAQRIVKIIMEEKRQ